MQLLPGRSFDQFCYRPVIDKVVYAKAGVKHLHIYRRRVVLPHTYGRGLYKEVRLVERFLERAFLCYDKPVPVVIFFVMYFQLIGYAWLDIVNVDLLRAVAEIHYYRPRRAARAEHKKGLAFRLELQILDKRAVESRPVCVVSLKF